jgi:hypothetical protein
MYSAFLLRKASCSSAAADPRPDDGRIEKEQ